MSDIKHTPVNNMTRLGPGGRPGGGPGAQMMARANAEKPHNTKGTIKRLLRYIGNKKYLLFMLILFMLLVTIIDVSGPFFQQKAIDTITLQEGHLVVDFYSMRLYLLIIAVIFVVSSVFTYIQGVLAARLSQDTVYSIRNELFDKMSRLPISYIDTHKHGDLMSRMTNDAENISNAVSQSITALVSSALTLIGALIMMLYYSPLLTIIAIVTIPLTIFISSKLASFMRKYFKTQQQLLGRLNGETEEKITGYKTVVAYGKETESVAEFSEVSNQLRTCSVKAKVWGSIMGPIMNFLGNLQYVLIAATGGFLMIRTKNSITIGGIQAMLQYSKKFSHPINMIANQYSIILTALAGAERIFEILDGTKETDEGTIIPDQKTVRGSIEMRDICFSYEPGKPILKHVSLAVDPGKKIAIVGATGSGKTTIVNLINRFYELDSGTICVDGVDITKIPKRELRKMIAIVLQDTILFHDSIRKNIKYGNQEASDELMFRAADMAMADRFILRLPNGYDTILAESGENLSQGQRQLLSIARAILADPKILILDEATSSVDTRTEMKIQHAMQNLMKGRTSLVIAHRLSTIRDSDLIVVLKDGEIAETGNHNELLQKQGEYYALYQKQFAGVTI